MRAQAQSVRLAPLQLANLQELGVQPALLRPYALPAVGKPRTVAPPLRAAASTADTARVAAPVHSAQDLIQSLRAARAAPVAPKSTAPKSTPSAAPAGVVAPAQRAAELVCQCYGAAGQARWLVVGEAARIEAHAPVALAQGRALLLLDAMLAAVQLQPMGDTLPWTDEIAPVACVLALGRVAAAALLHTADTLDKLRGQVWSCADAAGKAVPVVVTYPPGWLLSHPSDKRLAWRDLVLALGAQAHGSA